MQRTTRTAFSTPFHGLPGGRYPSKLSGHLPPSRPYSLLLALCLAGAVGCLHFDVDRSKIPECYAADECAENQICTDAGTCAKAPTPIPVGSQDAGGDASNWASVTGTATISSGLPAESYATGTLYLGLVLSCPSMTNQNPAKQVSTSVANADLSKAGNSAAFVFQSVAPGTYYLSGFFDHNSNADAGNPAPDKNDALGGTDMDGTGQSCIKVVVGSQDVTGVAMALNYAMPI